MGVYKKVSEIRSEYLLIGFLILMILPFLVLNSFNHPYAEDFYWVVERKRFGFIKVQYFFYEIWSGRFFSYAILTTVNPLIFKSFVGFKIFSLLLMLVFIYIIFLLISEITRNSLSFRERFLFSLSIFSLYLYAMPSVSQGFYYLTAAVIYHLTIILMLLFFIFYIRLSKTNKLSEWIFYTFISCLIVIAIAGSNEIGATLILMLITLLLIKNFFVEKQFNLSLIHIALFAGIAVYIAFSSPANYTRAQGFEENHNLPEGPILKIRLFYSIYYSFISLIQNVLSWTFNSPLLAFTLLLIPIFFKIIIKRERDSDIFAINPIYSLIVWFIFLFTSIFIMLWSVGSFPRNRVLNFIYFVFLIGWFYNVIVLIFYINRKFKISIEKFPKYLYAIAFIIIALFLIRENNVRTAYHELVGGTAYKYDNEMNERYNFLLQSNSDSCEVESLENIPRTLFVEDINIDPNMNFNKVYAIYFNKKAISLKKSNDQKK